ncbi:MAG: metalloregulator ArsR/SmtB family transcription factor [Thermoplasmata archaeon]|nr:metalloregulator ArsR/SmtB family transcription factor [Thermoplasmata archaeon]
MDVFGAIADPCRREMLELLARRERSAGELTKQFPRLSQPGVSRHLRVLREVGLVEAHPRAQQRIYSLRPERLRELDRWISRYRELWPQQLEALAHHLDSRPARSAPQRRSRP